LLRNGRQKRFLYTFVLMKVSDQNDFELL